MDNLWSRRRKEGARGRGVWQSEEKKILLTLAAVSCRPLCGRQKFCCYGWTPAIKLMGTRLSSIYSLLNLNLSLNWINRCTDTWKLSALDAPCPNLIQWMLQSITWVDAYANQITRTYSEFPVNCYLNEWFHDLLLLSPKNYMLLIVCLFFLRNQSNNETLNSKKGHKLKKVYPSATRIFSVFWFELLVGTVKCTLLCTKIYKLYVVRSRCFWNIFWVIVHLVDKEWYLDRRYCTCAAGDCAREMDGIY